eukprot:CAMPEP_0172473398 /NCGR_PEP_ID=MMETSP1065-20121228/68835_1 /TAXON_ID=265537 /ORGANISM="Amphiprora paludosa, Strain CCMP125" /LENGTH=1265 /DNA_ID=CAMNT_0013231573 /DNA_START=224 /DNA_END=4021 /DNA_ORIENTATION=-
MTSLTGNNPQEQGDLVTSKDSAKAIDHGGGGGGDNVEQSPADVDHSTVSTTEPSPQNFGQAAVDGSVSVVSAMTDHASIGGGVNNSSVVTTGLSGASHPEGSVPSQVILPESDSAQHNDGMISPEHLSLHPTSQPIPPPVEPQPTVIVTDHAPDMQSTVSMSALPDPRNSLEPPMVEKTPLHDRYVSAGAVATPVSSQQMHQQQHQMQQHQQSLPLDNGSEDTMDDYIRSPEVQNAIVERSPGGRYVRFMEKLGSGASKDVYRAYDTQEGIEVAWNVVILSGVPKSERNRIVNEVRLLERLHHANIISFHGSWVNRERQEVNFVTEILSSGTLKSFIKKVQVIRWKIAKRWATQILKGLEYLHSQEPPVIHRDLKCENIFINGTSGDLRIGDLGLSTVHRNGKVLSVLGTPEFMAPDMYEDRSYDEKVDIYAFGMCMLEILTKEIPYGECNNPAQIYKKVSGGEPPEVLSRLQSRHAREFVELCMGYRDESGTYVRPSATELLKHPFLDKRPIDEDEVVVERPLRERSIVETESNGSSMQRRSIKSTQTAPDTRIAAPGAATSQIPRNHHADPNSDEEVRDHFDDMPESETNMKKVKVLMGRDQVLTEDDYNPPMQSTTPSQPAASPMAPVYNAPQEVAPTPQQQNVHSEAQASQTTTVQQSNVVHYHQEASHPPQQQSNQQQENTHAQSAADTSQMHYLVAAAVIGNESPHIRPYADDILKLVVTLPVEGQTQNVQFDFHLVQDDPVKVAKEMVQELGIPQGAVLEISETISGLACSARMKQDKYTVRMQQNQTSQHSSSQPGMTQDAQSLSSQQTVSQIHTQSDMPQQVQVPSSQAHAATRSSGNSLPDNQGQHRNNQVFASQTPVAANTSNVTAPQGVSQPVSGVPIASGSAQSVQPQQAQSASVSENRQQVSGTAVPGMPHPSTQAAQQPQMTHSMQHPPASAGYSAQQQMGSNASSSGTAPPPMGSIPIAAAQQTATSVPTQLNGPPAATYSVAPTGGVDQNFPMHASATQNSVQAQFVSSHPQDPAKIQHGLLAQPSSTNVAPIPVDSQSGGSSPASPVPSKTGMPPRPQSVPSMQAEALAFQSETGHASSVRSTDQSFSSMNGMSPGSDKEMCLDTDDDEMRAELRKLEEDYQKNLKIAKKVFDSRMENLERSRIEKEVRHKETLEKHEKERLAFEKKRALEEEQQMKRIEQLQKEWDKKRTTLAAQRTVGTPSDGQSIPGPGNTTAPMNGTRDHQGHSAESSAVEKSPSGGLPDQRQ